MRTVLDDRTEFCSEEVRFAPDLKSTGTDQELRVHAAGELAGYWPAGTSSAVIRRCHAGDYDRSKEKPAVVGAQNRDPHWRLAPGSCPEVDLWKVSPDRYTPIATVIR